MGGGGSASAGGLGAGGLGGFKGRSRGGSTGNLDMSVQRGGPVEFDEEDLKALGDFETERMPQHLIDKGLITPFEFKPTKLQTHTKNYGWGRADPGFRDADFLSPSQFKNINDKNYSDTDKSVTNWITEMQRQRSEQYGQWKFDYGHFLGGAGTRLGSRFDNEEAVLNKKTLLAGRGPNDKG